MMKFDRKMVYRARWAHRCNVRSAMKCSAREFFNAVKVIRCATNATENYRCNNVRNVAAITWVHGITFSKM